MMYGPCTFLCLCLKSNFINTTIPLNAFSIICLYSEIAKKKQSYYSRQLQLLPNNTNLENVSTAEPR